MKIFGLGVPELVIILVVVLLIFGGKNLPKLGTAIGRTVKNLRDGMNGDQDKGEDAEEVVATVEDSESEPVKADSESKNEA